MSDDMDSSIKIEFGDLGDVISREVESVRKHNGFSIKPAVKFRMYRSDYLHAPMNGPFVYELDNFAFTREGTVFTAKAPSLNSTGTGELYKIGRFPMLRAFL
jgi:hypothetical protein